MELTSPINATIYPDFTVNSSGRVSVHPFEVSIAVTGEIPSHLIRSNLPISISVSIAEDLRPFTNLSLHAHSRKDEGAEEVGLDGSPFPSHSEGELPADAHDYDPSLDRDITFIPLPSTFNRFDPNHWARLSDSIRDFVVTLRPDSGLRAWGTDIFWISWVGAHLNFPHGDWPKWDGDIVLEGSFIESWVTDAYSRGPRSTAEDTLDVIWSEFLRYASPFVGGSIISSHF
ncbi:hypothetical protein CONPUDRAFT_155163 [Coniophora puteana RWD-64-598 SS2]|uniref:Uncharacterized protein n=1 Tax=Coniophora puteana (strain RWD-64-598) TaxID=741705 RepID=A0A5M3ML22_CONPW|nr:uncharacterized protein CONPUDRAFT_155163 [Coniophora puteana RWD-64-598 SS2]EIW79766.1 hypothetical protein CONPUDRAFT_155163 [Coniophora puteana RWD-64-598 SS2]